MKKLHIALTTMLLILTANTADARNTVASYNIQDVLSQAQHEGKLEGISFYFGDQTHPEVITNHGEFRTNKKTNAFNKSDLVACQWVFMSAMLQLHSRAKSLGANAVVNIKSNYKDNVVSSETQFSCGAGATMAGVALIGTIVKTK
jgi:hypothetical protein